MPYTSDSCRPFFRLRTGTRKRHRRIGPYETIQGLSSRLGLQINSPFAEGEEQKLAKAIVAAGSGVVLVCWEHQDIPTLANALPAAAGTTIPAAWPGDRFDVVWSFTAVAGSHPVRYTFSQVPQQLLEGDSDTVI